MRSLEFLRPSFLSPTALTPRTVGRLVVVVVAVTVTLAIQRPWDRFRGDAELAKGHRLHLADRADEALATYQKVLDRSVDPDRPDLRVGALLGLAEVLMEARGDLIPARKHLEDALAVARRQADPKLEADALASLGLYFWYYDRQRHRPLDEFYRPALERYEAVADDAGRATMHGRIALVHLDRGDYDETARHLEIAQTLFEALDDPLGQAMVHRFLGALHTQLERIDQAQRHYERSLEISEAEGSVLDHLQSRALIAHLHLRRQEFATSLEILDDLIGGDPNGALQAPAPQRRRLLINRGNALLHLARPEEARASYEEALTIDARLPGTDHTFRAITHTMLAYAAMQTGDLGAAEGALAKATAIPLEAKGWPATVTERLARADLASHSGQPREALHHLLAAAEIESQTFGSARSLFFQSQYRVVFDRLFSLLFDDVVPQPEAEALTFRMLEQMRYRSFRSLMVRLGAPVTGERLPTAAEQAAVDRVETLERRMLQQPDPETWDALRQAYAEYEDRVLRSELDGKRYQLLAEGRPVDLATAQAELAPEDVLVETVITGDRVFLLALTRQRVTSVVVPATRRQLEAKVRLFRHLVLHGDSDDADWRALSRDLGNLLLAPLEDRGILDGAKRLVLVPMGFFHHLPFAALHDAEGALLARRLDLVRTPSVTRWVRSRQRSNAPQPTQPLVAFGLRQAADPRLDPLDAAESEAAAVAQIHGGEARLGDAASESALVESARDSRWIHLAAHGVLEPRIPLHSHLVLAADDRHDGVLTVREILDLDLAAELVSLGACGTGLSPTAVGGEDLEVGRLGFVEAFLQAGADHVLASLLPVSDTDTAAFMTAFYRNLSDLPPDQALAVTRRQWLDHDTPPHPRTWAPFVLVSLAPSR